MMDILNRNQRRSAVWRIAALLGLIIAIFLTVIISMQRSYSNQGSGQIEILRDSLLAQGIQSAATINWLVLDTVRLSMEIQALKSNDAAQKEIEELKEEVEKQKNKLERKELSLEKCFEDLTKCETALKNKP